ncbi:UNVERIFIED_CONTAM: hypothetical protein Sangu_2906600 [Sesamum angustifolium]|uniref:Endonuclease/exonuclease/phosphatase domain-containing protein n=1 Tax=Sesamum angustifolium TaxID=2727405 RepID=A0AAW2ILZ9_9LAMI
MANLIVVKGQVRGNYLTGYMLNHGGHGFVLEITMTFWIIQRNLEVLRPNWHMRNFRKALADCELHDIGFTGDPFTWSNRHTYPHTVSERLDRACTNFDWSQLFPDASVSHIPVACSDHKALLIQLCDRPVQTQQWSRPWRFEAAWLQPE